MEQKQESTFEKVNNAIKNSISVKLLSIGFLIAILLIPQSMIKSLITERQSNQFVAVNEVSDSWAAPLELTGPILTIPFEVTLKDKEKTYRTKRYAHFLPEELIIDGDLKPETRKRGIYEVIVYSTSLSVTGKFSKIDLSQFTDQPDHILWQEATLSIGIPDMRGIQSDVKFHLKDTSYRMEPGIPDFIQLDLDQNDLKYGTESIRETRNQTGVNTRVKLDLKSKETAFAVDLDIRGTKTLMFNPVGKTTKVKIQSSWPHPSFAGQFLPDTHEISDSGFTATWSVFDLNRNYPQQWLGKSHSISNADFGVNLYQPVDNYQQNTRSAKYAVLILFLTFLSFFFIEVLNKKKIHPVQYILVGLTLTIFYTLLLSLSELIGFSGAYWVASSLIIAMLTAYSLSILKSKKLAGFMLLFFSLIYSFIFVILRMEDFSLLVGSFGLLIVLGFCMFLSRKVDWYNIKSSKERLENNQIHA
ncbi:cell envelope integrity protein CreD [Roseivirga sp. E12]|uniref:cell envelope integrity protein CreD n=1 Tax=Roseivirga sp. E12 TaxID=2819237 RepID=UPI001ABC7DB0|nr:cell envelope integrity protein CreD [Roseivirga sp. E12]MBO3698701.1 cell envelope integrity protein CreD [Roseivirga sp. E12]